MLFRAFVFTSLLGAAIVAYATPNARHIARQQVPAAVLERFAKEHRAVVPAGYTRDYLDGKEMFVIRTENDGLVSDYFYLRNGKLFRSDEQIPLRDLPKKIADAVRDKYGQRAVPVRAEKVRTAGERELEYKLRVRGEGIDDEIIVDDHGHVSIDASEEDD